MSLTVEDGTGKTDADAYASEVFVDTYNTNYVNDATWIAATSANKELAIRHATQFLDTEFLWRGRRKTGTQALDWPRLDVIDRNGYAVLSTIVPTAVQQACAELAIKDLTTGIQPDIAATSGELIEDTVEVGPITVKKRYSEGTAGASTQYVKVNGLLFDLILGGPGSALGTYERS